MLSQPFAPGSRIGARLAPRRELGRGALGIVYEAYDREFRAPVAVKVLRNRTASDARFLEREFRRVSTLRVPGMVQFYELIIEDGFIAVIMELVEGVDLLRSARSRPPGVRERFLIAAADQLARTLEALHDAGVVHGDIKPSNVLVSPAGEVTLVDFDLSTPFSQDEFKKADALQGTPDYLAPEIFAAGSPSSRSDDFALGATLLHAWLDEDIFGNPTLQGDLPLPPPPLGAGIQGLIRTDPQLRMTVSEFRALLRGAEEQRLPRRVDALVPLLETFLTSENGELLILSTPESQQGAERVLAALRRAGHRVLALGASALPTPLTPAQAVISAALDLVEDDRASRHLASETEEPAEEGPPEVRFLNLLRHLASSATVVVYLGDSDRLDDAKLSFLTRVRELGRVPGLRWVECSRDESSAQELVSFRRLFTVKNTWRRRLPPFGGPGDLDGDELPPALSVATCPLPVRALVAERDPDLSLPRFRSLVRQGKAAFIEEDTRTLMIQRMGRAETTTEARRAHEQCWRALRGIAGYEEHVARHAVALGELAAGQPAFREAAERALGRSEPYRAAQLMRELFWVTPPGPERVPVLFRWSECMEASGRTRQASMGFSLLAGHVQGEARRQVLLRAANAGLMGGRLSRSLSLYALAEKTRGQPWPRGSAGELLQTLLTLAFEAAPVPSPVQKPARGAAPLDVEWTAAVAIGAVEPILGLILATRCSRRARQTGDLDVYIASLALTGGAVLAPVGGALGRLGERVLAQAKRRALNVRPATRGILQVAEGFRLCNHEKWIEANAAFESALELFGHDQPGNYRMIVHTMMGFIRCLEESDRLEEAEGKLQELWLMASTRSDTYAMQTAAGYMTSTAVARRDLEASRYWRDRMRVSLRPGMSVQRFYSDRDGIEILLEEGRYEDARAAFLDLLSAAKASRLDQPRVLALDLLTTSLRVRAPFTDLNPSTAEKALARRLEKQGSPQARVLSRLDGAWRLGLEERAQAAQDAKDIAHNHGQKLLARRISKLLEHPESDRIWRETFLARHHAPSGKPPGAQADRSTAV
ncbi:MAG: serine/threonine-protein kinase [Myxococcota bacterium]